MKEDIQKLQEIIETKPNSGIPLGNGIYKIRITIASKGKGKSGGARVITYLVTESEEVYLVYIYDKSQLDNITKKEITELLENAGLI